MTRCAAPVFSGITQAHFACLVAKAATQGIDIAGDSGSASKDGLTVTWNYEPETESLTIQCVSAPFFLGCGTINANIHNLIDSCT
jgi:hypothetical protein